jgi:hypothetical protein
VAVKFLTNLRKIVPAPNRLFPLLFTWLLSCLGGLAWAEPRINEFTAAGQTVLADEDGGFHDFIEIFNPGFTPMDLGGWHLTDDLARPRKWTFPARTLRPGDFLVVFASAKNRAPEVGTLHTDFRLSAAGEMLALTRPDGSVAQAITFPVQRPEVSFDGVNFLSAPTPGSVNAAPLVIAAAPGFSHSHGIYDAPFALTLSTAKAGAEIRYTLDGTEPTATLGTRYTAPLAIAKTTVVRAAAFAPGAVPSPVVAQTYLFPKDIVKQSPSGQAPAGWPKKWGQATVDYGMDPRITRKAPYKNSLPDDLRAIPSISIALPLPDLFDPAEGIYANPFMKGIDWERPMSIELIDPAGGPGFQTTAGLRIRGGASRDPGNPKHSFQIRFRSSYGAPVLKYPLFGEDGAAVTARFDLRWDHLVSWHYGNTENATQLPDIFGRDTQLATGSPAKRGAPYHLYINGQYWGVYFTDERVSSDWAAAYFGGGDDDYDVVKFDADANFGTGYADGTPAAWRRLIDAGRRGFHSNADYFRVQGRNADGARNPSYERLLDVDNLIDYMVVGIYCAATDNPPSGGTQNNWYGFRSRKNDFGFRFFVHDFELSMHSVEDDVLGRQPQPDPFEFIEPESANPWHFWEALRQNAEFRLRVADRLHRHFFNGGVLTPEACAARWQERMDELDRAMVAESARWGQPTHGGIWFKAEGRPISPGGPGGGGGQKKQFTREDWRAAATAKLTDYFPQRSGVVLQQFKEANLYPATAAPEYTLPAQPGDGLVFTNPNPTGTIYFTLDGSDPRKVGGTVAETARAYTLPIRVTRQTVVKARVRDGGSAGDPQPWSALVEVTLVPGQDFGALRVTEIHYHPPSSGGISSGDAEFLELKNTGTVPLDLSGCAFSAGIGYSFPSGTTLLPGAHYVIASNAAVFAQLYPGVNLHGTYTGRLADEGETLTLRNASGLTLFSFAYDDAAPWPRAADGAGFSLVSAGDGDPGEPDNWRASSQPGGSPGADDPAPPGFPRVVISELLANEDPTNPAASQDAIELHNLGDEPADLSGWLLTNDFNVPAKFQIPDGTIVPPHGFVVFRAADFAGAGLALPSEGGEAWLFSADSGGLTGYTHGFAYGAQSDGVSLARYVASDRREYLAAASAPSLGAANPDPLLSPVRISEIHYAPVAGEDEFLELENTQPAPALLGGARLNGLGFTFPDGAAIPANAQALVVTIAPVEFRQKYAVPASVPIYGPAPGRLQDDGEIVSLEVPVIVDGQPGFQVVETLRYNDRRPWPTTAAGHGDSLQRIAAPNFSAEVRSWLAGPPSPGLANTLNAPPQVVLTSPLDLTDVVPPALVPFAASASDPDGTIAKVQFLVDNEVVGEDATAPYALTWRPTPGLHDLTARATDNAGAVTESDFVTIDVDAPENGTGLGLRGEYFANPNFSGVPVVREDPVIDFDWVEVPPIAGVPRRNFSVRWTGRLLARRSGEHRFDLGVMGRVRLFVGEALVLEADGEQDASGHINNFQGFATLQGGELVDFVVEYVDTDAVAHIDLRWAEPGEFDSPILPETQLYLPGQDAGALGIATANAFPPRQRGRSFRAQFRAANGSRPYTWSLAGGALPPGLSLSSDGRLAGTPTRGGSFGFLVRVMDAAQATAEKAFTLRVVDSSRPELRPAVEITEPTEGTEFPGEALVRVRGAASGPRTIAEVRYALNGSLWHTLPSTADFSFTLSVAKGLRAGRNEVQVQATDVEGRSSPIARRTFERVVFAPLTVSIRGAGTITPGFLGTTTRRVGKEYTIAATPAPGWIFTQWEGLFDARKRLTFQMSEGLEMTAVFEPDPFPALAGHYSTLLEPAPFFPGPRRGLPGEVRHETRGAVSVRLTPAGTFSGLLDIAGVRFPFLGRFTSGNYYFRNFIDPRTGRGFFLNLVLLRETGALQAQVSSFDDVSFFESTGLLTRSSFSAQDNPCPLAGRYTLQLGPNDAALPPGTGFATLIIGADGRTRCAGELADGTPWSKGPRLRDDLALPLYVAVQRGTGSFSGWLAFTTQRGVRGNGEFFWSKAKSFAGFGEMKGSPYAPPAPGEAVLALPSGLLTLDGGGLVESIAKTVSLDATHVFTVAPPGSEGLNLRVDPATGLLRGSFQHPLDGETALRGIVDQLEQTARGYFPGGALSIDPP